MHPLQTSAIREKREKLGQFFTALPVADFMASLFEDLPQKVRLLDAGAGTGSLTKAFVSRCCNENTGVRTIEATLYEIDSTILNILLETMKECERLCARAGIHFTFSIHDSDFIQEISERLAFSLFDSALPAFDAAILNPPYRKIGANSEERTALSSANIETSNLYTGFVALVQRLLIPGGQLVAITPRSFCNGPYFHSFRADFLKNMELRRLHVFESRREIFRNDGVLQENIIFHASKGCEQPPEVTVSCCEGTHIKNIAETVLDFSKIVHPNDDEVFIHIPSSDNHASVLETISSLDTSLASLGLTVSTGRVVDFRLQDALRKEPIRGTVPLLYPCHFNGGTVHWPKTDGRKSNAILDDAEVRPWLVPSGIYLLTKRFTAKEERRRLVACLFDPDKISAERIGIENHLNYFHANGRGLERNLAVGLYIFLNSTVIDQYFRQFSGHTQVNATDLRTLPYPAGDTLRAIGRKVKNLVLTQEEIDQLLDMHIHDNDKPKEFPK